MRYAIFALYNEQFFVTCNSLKTCIDMLQIRHILFEFTYPDYKKAKKIIKPYLDEGDPEAEYLYAQFPLDESISEDENDSKRWELITSSSEKNYPPAIYKMGASYDDVENSDSDRAKAAQYFKKAAKLGHAHSQWIYGQDLLFGNHGINKDETLGMEWLMKSVEAKSEGAIQTLIHIHEKGLFGFSNDKEEVAKLREKLKDPDVIDCPVF